MDEFTEKVVLLSSRSIVTVHGRQVRGDGRAPLRAPFAGEHADGTPLTEDELEEARAILNPDD